LFFIKTIFKIQKYFFVSDSDNSLNIEEIILSFIIKDFGGFIILNLNILNIYIIKKQKAEAFC
jgi:hypothetical protein